VKGNPFKVPASRFQVLAWGTGLVWLFFTTVRAMGGDAAAEFDLANKAYEEGRYLEAAASYEPLIQQGAVSPTLWFNLGNARFKAGEIGRAIAAYRQAELLSPRDPDVLFNLQFARKKALGSDVPPGPWLDRTLRSLSLNEWTLLACASLWGWFGLLAAGQAFPQWRRRVSTWVVLFATITVIFGAALAGAVRQRYVEKEAVVVAREAAVRHGPLEESKTAFTAHDGTEVQVLDQLSGWWQVKDPSGRIGWIRQSDAMLLSAVDRINGAAVPR
jgi:hypothetical protein